MKKSIQAALLLAFVIGFVGCSKTYDSTEHLIDKVRKEIPVAEAETAEIEYAGMTVVENNALLWYISGNAYQNHTYFPIECEITGEAEYKYVRCFHIILDDRCDDVGILHWNQGYAFCINNPECKTVRITDNAGTHDEVIEKDQYPYVFYTQGLPSEYIFLDADGNELR